MTTYAQFDGPIGRMLVTASQQGLTGIYFAEQKYEPEILSAWSRDPGLELLSAACRQLDEYFRGARTRFDLRLDPRGTPFQMRVWRALMGIPFGETTTYRAVAQELGSPAATRAVGAAVGRNPISIVVPCHRVVGSDGSLTGYAGGLDRKRALLALERPRAARPLTQSLFPERTA
jgi:methylated-DNA-[protein]-cysteine S-methyltransferase